MVPTVHLVWGGGPHVGIPLGPHCGTAEATLPRVTHRSRSVAACNGALSRFFLCFRYVVDVHMGHTHAYSGRRGGCHRSVDSNIHSFSCWAPNVGKACRTSAGGVPPILSTSSTVSSVLSLPVCLFLSSSSDRCVHAPENGLVTLATARTAGTESGPSSSC